MPQTVSPAVIYRDAMKAVAWLQKAFGLKQAMLITEASGAQIVRPPQDELFGHRVYRAKDLEGHVWTFSQSVRAVTREDAEKASGLKIEGWTD